MKAKSGFTLIEILIVMAILCMIIAFGSIIDLSAFKSDNFEVEKSKIISVLERARSHSMANMFDSSFGVCYIAPDYIIFRGGTCTISATSETISANTNITTSFAPTAIIFEGLTGNTTSATIHLTDGIKSADININNEGTISW